MHSHRRHRVALGALGVLLALAGTGCLIQVRYDTVAGANSLAVLDVDQDGRVDLIALSPEGDKMAIHFQSRWGNFYERKDVAIPRAVRAVDLAAMTVARRDRPTLVVADAAGERLLLFSEPEKGGPPDKSIPIGAAPVALDVADLDNDGYDDLAVLTAQPVGFGCIVDGCLVVFFGAAAGLEASFLTTPVGEPGPSYRPEDLALGDVDADRVVDAVVSLAGTNEIVVFEGLRAGKFEAPRGFQRLHVGKKPGPIAIVVRQDGITRVISRVAERELFVAEHSRATGHLLIAKGIRAATKELLDDFRLVPVDGTKRSRFANLSLPVDLDRDGRLEIVSTSAGAFTVFYTHRLLWLGPDAVDLGKAPVGEAVEKQIVGEVRWTPEEIHDTVNLGYRIDGGAGDFTLVRSAGCTLDDPKNTCGTTVRFAPTSAGRKTAKLRLTPAKASFHPRGATAVEIVLTAVATPAPPPPPSPPSVTYGVVEDRTKYDDDGGAALDGEIAGAGMRAMRWTLLWDAAQPTAIAEAPFVDRALPQAVARGIDVFVTLHATRSADHDPEAFCSWAESIARRWPQITRFIIWNEPNTVRFWAPQPAADAYYVLLKTCYDRLKAVSPAVTVVGVGLSSRAASTANTTPVAFVKALGAAFRADGRTRPIMDALSIHPYANPDAPQQPPETGYPGNAEHVGVPNLDRLKQAVYDAFNGTQQPTTLTGLKLVIGEFGWQVDTSALPGYVNAENVNVVDEATQAAYLARSITNFFACDPAVSHVFIFKLLDERERNGRDETGQSVGGGWQSGLLRVDRSRRPSYDAVRSAIATGCATGVVNWTPTSR